MSRIRLLLICTAILLLLGAGTVWILNIENIIQGSWSNPLTAVFVVLGVLIAFCQWVLPLSPPSLSSSLLTQKQAYSMYLSELEATLTENIGAIVVQADLTLLNREVTAENQRTFIVRRRIVNQTDAYNIYVATLTKLKPGSYMVKLINQDIPILFDAEVQVMVYPGQISEIDLQNKKPPTPRTTNIPPYLDI